MSARQGTSLQPVSGSVAEEHDPVALASSEKDDEETPRKGTVFSSMVNLGGTCMGVGILSLPQAFAYMGWALGIVLLLCTAFVSDLTLQLLVDVSRASKCNSYEGNAEHYLGSGGKWTINISLIALIFMAQVAFVIVIKQLVPKFIQSIGGEHPDAWYGNPYLVTVICLLLIFPVCLLKTLTALRYTSSLVLFSVFYVVTMIAVHFIMKGEIHETVVAFNDNGWEVISGLAVVVAALICHFNIFAIDKELQTASRPKVRRIIHMAMVMPTMVYMITGLTGYFLFGAPVKNNVLEMFGKPGVHPLDSRIAKILLALANMCKLPLHTHPFRVCLGEALPASCPRNAVVETFLLLAATLGLALVLQSLSKSLALLGCTCGVICCFVLPGFMHLQMHKIGTPSQSPLVGSSEERPVPPLTGAMIKGASWCLGFGGILYMVMTVIATIVEWNAF